MRIATLDNRMPLAALRRELRYTLLRAKRLFWAKPWVLIFDSLLSDTELVEAQLRKLQDGLEDAEAELDDVDEDLDRLVLQISADVRAGLAGGPRDSLLKALFGTERPSNFIKPRLGDELEQVRKWPTILAGAPIAKLVAYKPQVEAIVNRCDDAIQKHSESQAAILALRLTQIEPLFAKVNGERASLGGEARKQTMGGDGREVDGLFRSLDPKRRVRIDTLESVRADIGEAEATLAERKARLSALEAAEAAAVQAAADLKAKEAALAELLRTQAETEAKAAALRLEIEKSRKG